MRWEISELNSPTALRRFGAPFKSDLGEVTPYDSELPILRFIFVHHVREFPFLDKAREKEFWQDKLQVFLESFASKNISSSEDRLEETKRRKLALKSQKLVELMMVSGIPTSSGFEERIRFSEMEVVDRDAIDTGVLHTQPEGNYINGWDVNMAGVRVTKVRGNIRSHKHAVSLSYWSWKLEYRLTPARNSCYASRKRETWSTLLAAAMVTSAASTRTCVSNCQARSCHHCPRRTSPAPPLPAFSARVAATRTMTLSRRRLRKEQVSPLIMETTQAARDYQ